LDYEGDPLKIKVMQNELVTAENLDDGAAGGASVVSPMPGRIVKLFAKAGDSVKKGDKLVSVESMKMEYFVKANADGVVDQVLVNEGDAVQLKQRLIAVQ